MVTFGSVQQKQQMVAVVSIFTINDGVTSSQWVDVSQPGTGIEYLSKTEDDTAAGAITFKEV